MNKPYAGLCHMFIIRHFLKLSLPSYCFHVGIFIFAALGIYALMIRKFTICIVKPRLGRDFLESGVIRGSQWGGPFDG